MKIKVST